MKKLLILLNAFAVLFITYALIDDYFFAKNVLSDDIQANDIYRGVEIICGANGVNGFFVDYDYGFLNMIFPIIFLLIIVFNLYWIVKKS